MVRQILKEVAQLQNRDNTSVLIVGESGAGKELVARAIHLGGVRAKGPFVPVNCAAIPNDLAEASFFGHVRGAFTGADRDRKGFFELADGGTLFLDEVSDMPLTLQAKLLRVLEDRIVQPVGSSQAIRVDVRVVAATNADLMAKVTTGQFRRDLYYRLAVMPVRVPPLRERKDDLPLLVDHFLSLFAHEMRIPVPTLSLEALQVLQAYNFPGNVRELKNMIEFALIRSEGNMLLPAHLPETGVGVVTESVSDPARPLVGSEATRVLAYVQKHGSIGNAECCDLLKVNRRHATLVLNKLCDAEKLAKTGSRRWTRYQLLAN